MVLAFCLKLLTLFLQIKAMTEQAKANKGQYQLLNKRVQIV
jgi:hypothetical protein